ncbi:MAG: RNA-binding transcriptional accessory protein [Tissierellia bacterium]|nr:RNA-binding transcriptional accessory protein [Tissierellia bacterium]
MQIFERLARELDIQLLQVQKTVELMDEGNTLPFIARYRKEVTGNLDDVKLRELEEKLQFYRSLEERKTTVARLLQEQGLLTEELEKSIEKSTSLQQIEDIYRPYRPKKRTRATIAIEKGLEPLANYIMEGMGSLEELLSLAEECISEEKEIQSAQEALVYAQDILADRLSDDVAARGIVRKESFMRGNFTSEAIEGADSVYEIYWDFSEPVRAMKPHRTLAIFRGEKEGSLRIGFDFPDEEIIEKLKYLFRGSKHPFALYIDEAVEDGYKRLLRPSIETETRNALKEVADSESIDVFKKNLRPYLMQAPLSGHVVMGLDPGFRTGCKLAVVGPMGELLDYGTIFPTKPRTDIEGAKKVFSTMVEKYGVSLFAIGNGTASRETEQVVASFIEEQKKELHYCIVNESGASIYSASPLAREEFPDLDVSIRGAISIARRIQDPLAELVKIEPKHIGIGQYQHDVNQKLLDESLEKVVEDCVNAVGVNLNQASFRLLSYVAGISKNVAKNIVKYKEEKGGFKSRKELFEVKGLGPKTFEQCAGFLRVPESSEPLDHTAVHPESYSIARPLLGRQISSADLPALAQQYNIGLPTLSDIVEELKKPGRDPREEMPKPILRSDVLSLADLKEGMILTGTVRNVVDFGAFVDIGVKEDGLVHISKISDKYIKHPSDVLQVADIVKVKIIGIDAQRNKISLSMRDV